MESFKLNEGFFDLCVNIPDGGMDNLNDILLRLYEMGYRTVALNQIVNESAMDNNKKKKDETKQVTNVVPDPIDVSKLNEKWKGKLNILNRLTFICSNSVKVHTLEQCPNLKKYDIYALSPTKQDMLEFACQTLKADLITIKPEISGIKINQKIYRQAVARDLYFEIQYVDLLRPETRVAALHRSYKLQMCRVSMNIIISSGANNRNLIRNPYDIVNLGFVLGLRRDKIKSVILNECQLLLLKAKKRLFGKSVFAIEIAKNSDVSDDEEIPKKQSKKSLN
ncbi:PREDICTED: ribonuclease P protein subunit p30-like [Cyphomyrmex costatus]|uniref:Ribonuclease P protein subunit p30 n=1 Tax=Cyphomyrmex costatus TaxID=456900 RepID=A0A195CAX9_9HYME|nr:PREDICTED: ribonuclease P protein subunit p30-like [Cyphomyrmex costatus]KYM97263.1 Ribonuclease P protein subunit p30 [Cyphomyrmex costatus]